MRTPLLTSSLLLAAFGFGCPTVESPADFEDGPADSVDRDQDALHDGAELATLDAPATARGDGDVLDHDDEPVDNTPDEPEDDEPVVPGEDEPGEDLWDAAPPDVPNGTLLEGTIHCGLLTTSANLTWEKTGARWDQLPGGSTGLLPGLEVCTGRGPRTLQWDEEPSIYIEAGGLAHWLFPTAVADYWAGAVEPVGPEARSQDCLDVLDSYGLMWPVQLSFEVTAIYLPEGA